MKRVREVYDSDMVAHIWMSQSQSSARNGGANNFFFEADTIYSYGHHFAIARIVKLKQSWQSGGGERQCVLFTTRTYSVTTAKHIGIVRSACRNQIVFHVPHVHAEGKKPCDHKRNLEHYESMIAHSVEQAQKARNKGQWLSQMGIYIAEANEYCQFFSLKRRFERPKGVDYDALEAKGREWAAGEEERQRKRDEKRRREAALWSEQRRREDEERRLEAAEALPKWLAGELLRSSFHSSDPVYLRVKGDNLETSMGAEVPLEHAKRAFAFIAKCKAEGTTYQRNGHSIHVGHFVIDSIDAEGNVKAGCHNIKWPEIERIAKQLGLITVEDAVNAKIQEVASALNDMSTN